MGSWKGRGRAPILIGAAARHHRAPQTHRKAPAGRAAQRATPRGHPRRRGLSLSTSKPDLRLPDPRLPGRCSAIYSTSAPGPPPGTKAGEPAGVYAYGTNRCAARIARVVAPAHPGGVPRPHRGCKDAAAARTTTYQPLSLEHVGGATV